MLADHSENDLAMRSPDKALGFLARPSGTPRRRASFGVGLALCALFGAVFAPSALGFLAGSLAYFVVNQTISVIAISLSTSRSLGETWRKLVGFSLAFDLVTGQWCDLPRRPQRCSCGNSGN